MEMIDFIYNGESLSDYGCVPAFITSGSEDNFDLRSTKVLNTVKSNNINRLITTDFDETLTATFDIMKNTCASGGDLSFNDYEVYSIMSWLDRNKYFEFKPVLSDGNFYDVYFMGIFTSIQAVRISGKIVGFTLTLTTNAPYGFGNKVSINKVLNSSEPSLIVSNDSMERGSLYPTLFEITCKSDGTLKINNNKDLDDNDNPIYLKIDNCVNGEIITINCDRKTIISNKPHPKLCNDFNYNFPRLVQESYNTLNTFTLDTSLMSSAEVTIEFNPVRKVGVII